MASEGSPGGPSAYSIRRSGPANSVEHMVYVQDAGNTPISAVHDVPLYVNRDASVVRMVVTVPRWTNAKMMVRNVSCRYTRVAMLTACPRLP